MLCKLAKLCIDPETPELLLGELRAWDVVIVLAGSSSGFGEICLEMGAAESLQQNIGCAALFPRSAPYSSNSAVCLRAGREGEVDF